MALILPDFKDRKCLQLDLCGCISLEEDADIGELPKVAEPLISQYTKSGKKIFLGMVLPFPGSPTDKHVHLKLTTAEVLGSEVPKTNAKPEEVLRIFEPLLGKHISAELDGVFRVSKTNLSPLIRSTFVEASVDKIRVRMTGGKLSVRGAPIHTITWKLLGKKEEVEFLVEARTKATFDGSYLVDALDMIESAFTALVKLMERVGEGLKKTSRLNALETRLRDLEAKLVQLLTRESLVVPINSLAPEPFEILLEIKAVVQKVDEDEFIATFFDANVSAAGCNPSDAVENLKGLLVSRFEFLDVLPADKLGRGPAKQIAVLRQFLAKKD